MRHGVKCAIDISDGLLSDLGHILKASGVGARLEAETIPLHPALAAGGISGALGLALGGGEDYELLFTASWEIIERAAAETGCPVTVIGEITAEPGLLRLVDPAGKEISVDDIGGWRHF